MRWGLLVILPLFTFSIWGQTPSWQLNELDPALEVEDIKIDTLGFLWMNDKHSFYRFDGIEATSKLNLKDELITSVFSHPNHFVLGTSNGRLITFNPYDGEQEIIQEGIDNRPITALSYIDINNYVTLSYGRGVTIVTEGNSHFYDNDSGLISNEVYDISYFNEKYYVASDQGIQVFDGQKSNPIGKTLSPKSGLVDIVITNLLVHQGKLYYTDYDQHIGYLDSLNVATNFRLPEMSKIHNLTAFNKSLYISTNSGLYEFSNGNITSEFLDIGEVKIKVAKVDEEGNLWLVTGDHLIYRGNVYFQKITTKFDEIRTIGIFQDRLFIGNEDGLYVNENDNITMLSNDNVTHLSVTEEYLFVGTFSEGMKVYDPEMRMVSHVDTWSSIKNQSVLHIYNYEDDIYVSSLSGVMRFEMENNVIRPSESLNSIIGIGYIYTILAKGNQLYFGTDRNGLIILDKAEDKIQKLPAFSTGEKIGSIYSMTFDSEGQLWFTSSNEGIGVLKSGIPQRLVDPENSADEYTSIASLTSGDLLAIRSSSVDLIDPKQFNFMNFDKEIGLENEVTFLNNTAQDGDKTFFVNSRSIYRFIPETIFKIHPEVIIDKVLVNLSEVDVVDRNFAQDENNIEFYFTGSWLTDPTKLLYQYRLIGFDPEWRTTKDRSVAFPRLSPGKYEFELRASENGSFDNEPIAVRNFEIKRHFYNIWWIRILAFGFLAMIGLKILSERESRKKEKQALEKLNIENQLINLKNQLNPHFLFNAFNTLIGLIEEDSDRSVDFVAGMTDFYRNMLEYGEENLISLAKEKEILEQYIDILKARFNGQLDITLDIKEQVNQYFIPPMTLQLLVENAVKHNIISSKKPLKINICQTGEKIQVSNIKRPLIGDSSGAKIGLKNMNKRFELVGLSAPIINNNDDAFEIILELKSNE